MRFLKTIVFLFTLLLASCAKLPVESTDLSHYLIAEGDRMHRMNIQLVNTMFKEKREKIDLFIKEEFAPSVIARLLKQVDPKDDPKETIEGISGASTREAIAFRDELQSALETSRIKIITRLEEDYSHYREAAEALKKLIASAVKVNNERKKLLDDLKQYSNNKLDLNSVEAVLDKHLSKAGKVGEKISDLNSELEEILKK